MLLISTASAFCCSLSLATLNVLIADDSQAANNKNNIYYNSNYDNNGNNNRNDKNEIIMLQQQHQHHQQQQQQQQQRLRQLRQTNELRNFNEQLKQQMQRRQYQQQQQLNIEHSTLQHITDPFDFANLRQLQQRQQYQQKRKREQQIGERYKRITSDSNNNNNNYNYNNDNDLEQQQQEEQREQEQATPHHQKRLQQREQQQPSKENNDSNNNNNNAGYSYYLDGNKNKKGQAINSNNNNDNGNNGGSNDGVGDTTDDIANYGNPNDGDDWLRTLAATSSSASLSSSSHPDESNGFRLQLSDKNGLVTSEHNTDDDDNNNNNSNNNNKKNGNQNESRTRLAGNTNRNSGYDTAINGHHHHPAEKGTAAAAATCTAMEDNDEGGDCRDDNNNNDDDNDNGHRIQTRSSRSLPNDLENYGNHEIYDFNNDNELAMNLPYGIQNVRKRTMRDFTHLEQRSEGISYQSLCPTKRVTIPLETAGFEYRPNHYIEVTCAHSYTPTYNFPNNKNKICSEAGFSCIQLNRTIHLIRRNKASKIECWESEIRIVPSGCECMWPKHLNGDILTFHDTQKRFSAAANVRPVADYTPGEGYLQIPRQIELVSLDGTRREESNDGTGFETYTLYK